MTNEGRSKVLVLGNSPRVAARSESSANSITVYGSPSINARAVTDADLSKLTDDPNRYISTLDGEFLVVIVRDGQVVVANDRFGALPVFYLEREGELVISFSYSELWKWLSANDRLDIESLAFYEFLHFQRLFSETTFDKHSKALTPASLLTFDSRKSRVSKTSYWTPDFTKRSDGRDPIASDLADAVKRSIATKTNDSENPSLLLSGGMDSRVALGGFPPNSLPHCITIGETKNNEVEVAQSLAQLIGAKHSFVQRSPTHYEEVLPEAIAKGAGMYSFQHGHFFELEIPETDLILHGHAFDYFFQGMYLPTTRRKFLGRSTRAYSLNLIGFDLVGEYIQQAKYRLKGINPSGLLKPELAAQAIEKSRADLDAVLKPTTGNTAEPYDQWDFLTTSAPGRHYTYLNLLSAGSLAEQRTIAFSNEILDLYYSTPAKVRQGTTLLAATIKRLDPRLLEVRNANTNMRPDLSPIRLTVNSWLRGLKRRTGLTGSSSADPSQSDRSWPSDADIVERSENIKDRVSNLHKSEGLNSLDIFDESEIAKLATSVKTGDSSGASALLSLITIDQFLSGT